MMNYEVCDGKAIGQHELKLEAVKLALRVG
jgi:hypothetical protein